MSKGSQYERELVNGLESIGYTALRAPSSGSATKRDLPDVLAGRTVEATLYSPNGNPYTGSVSDALAIEAKAGDATTLYVDESEVEALERFSEAFGATPYLSARFTTRSSPTSHFLVRPSDARLTDGGNYGLPLADIEEIASHRIDPVPREAVDA